jgi:hypothetical protein
MQVTKAEATLGGLVVNEMRLMYGAKFSQQWQGLTPRALKDSWDEKLAGMTEREIRTGLVACLARDWPPTVPEFLRLCRPWASPEVAFHDAVAGIAARRRGDIGLWPHPAVYWAAVAVGAHDLLNCGYSVMKARWERALTDELAKGQWAPVPEPLPALPGPGQTLATREEAEAAMKRLGADKVLIQGGRDQRRWARKILDEQERKGGQRYSLAVLAMARRALDLPVEATS